ncbi:alpha/beta-hydrolase [Rhodofomes roseus]|uniref:Alpha/beta-hydrolase n=1 Tax=Rhodofomes roseus TaxID=34475 RepID=A0ABQ8K9J7_9APHY|nr:alpha/beta-hydrolase [Rhodofomes roseus]KAH9833872.1 alpha/beta-hydrolase [Rhodofomes roseus]
MPPSSALQWFLLVLPAAVLLAYLLTAFPLATTTPAVQPSLATLPKDSPSWQIYPETFYDGGAYVHFPQGSVRYWLIGPEKGQRVVLIHGLSVPAIIWKDVAPQLAHSGIRVLLYDLYGRGYSDAPQTTYDSSLYTTQLALLMQYVGWDKAHIAGVSMGGGVAAAFNAQFPHLVSDKVALLAPTGLLDPTDLSRTTRFLSSPIMQLFTASWPVRLYIRYLANSHPTDDPIAELVRLQSAYLPGFNAAVASSLRDGPVRSLAPAYAALGRRAEKDKTSVLLVWGTSDAVVPYKTSKRVRTLVPSAQLLTIEGGSHDITITHAKEVGAALVRFFKGQPLP